MAGLSTNSSLGSFETRDIAAQSTMKEFQAGEILDDDISGDSDIALDRFIRRKALMTHHPLCTCKMG